MGSGQHSHYSELQWAGCFGVSKLMWAINSLLHTIPDWLWGPSNQLYNGYGVPFPWAKQSGHSFYHPLPHNTMGQDSAVGIANRYGLDGPGIESRWGARFSSPVQTGPGAHPASCTMGTGSFPGVKSGRGVTLTPHPLLVPQSWSRAIHLLPPWAVQPVQSFSACTRVHFTLFLNPHNTEVQNE